MRRDAGVGAGQGPTVFRAGGFRFFFCSNEGHPRGPARIRVEHGDAEAKFWVRPDVRSAYNEGSNAKTLREIADLVEANNERIEGAWDGFFG